VDLGPGMWRELCVRSASTASLGERSQGPVEFTTALPLLPTNPELSTPEYLFTLPTEALHRGLTAPGGPRFAKLVAKLDRGEPITVVSLGGSVTAHGGCWGPPGCTVYPPEPRFEHANWMDYLPIAHPYERPFSRPSLLESMDTLGMTMQMQRFMNGRAATRDTARDPPPACSHGVLHVSARAT